MTTVAMTGSGLVAGTGATILGPVSPVGAAAEPFPPLAANATWLETVNAWRSASDLAPVTEDTTFSAGDLAHSTYIVETGDFGHDESEFLEDGTTPNPWYSVAGNDAGTNGNVAASSDATKSDRRFVEQWITAPFHAAGILDPMLVTSGFGSYRRADATPYPAAATLDVIRGRTGSPVTTATVFPGNDSTLPVAQQAYRGGESPDPLSPCPGYNPGTGPINTGTPLFALLPNAPTAATLTATVTRDDDVPVESCAYDETSYTNPVGADQTLGQQVLASRHQVVVIPRQPLVQGSEYTVSISVTYQGEMAPTVTEWKFTAESEPLISIGNASVVEGNARARLVRLTVSLSKPYVEPVTVSYATVAHTATAGSDFVAKSGTLTIPAGGTSGVITIQVKGDKVAEQQETFTVMLSNAVHAKRWRTQGIATIINDDNPTDPAPRVSIGSASLVEGDTGTRALRFAVTLSASVPTRAVTVQYATQAGSANTDDFSPITGTLTIPARAVSGVLLIRIKPELVGEDTEKFTVKLTSPSGAALHPTRSVGTGTISDDD
jgi:hypothetical protein